MKCTTKHKEKINVLKYTLDNQKYILDLLGDLGELDPEVEFVPNYKPQGNIWISNWNGGDILKIDEYLGFDGEFYVARDFEDKFKFSGKYNIDKLEIWEERVAKEFECIQWLDDNVEECLRFLNKNGNLDKSKQQILIMNFCGGSVCNKGDYILKYKDDYFSVDEDYFKKNFKVIN